METLSVYRNFYRTKVVCFLCIFMFLVKLRSFRNETNIVANLKNEDLEDLGNIATLSKDINPMK